MSSSIASTPQAMAPTVRRLLRLLNRQDRWKLILYVAAQFALSLTEVIGIAAILPLVQLMTDAPLDEGYIGILHRLLGTPERSSFVTLLGLFIVAAFVIKAGFGLLVTWWGSGFTSRLQFSTQRQLFSRYLSEPYPRHRQRNTAEVVRTTGQAVSDAFQRVLGGLLAIISTSLSILVMLALLFAVLPLPTIIAIAYLGCIMLLIDRILAPRAQAASRDYLAGAFDSSKTLLESFQGFREVRMLNKEGIFLERYCEANERAIYAGRRTGFLQQLPRYALELSVVIGLVALIVVLANTSQSSAIGSLAVFITVAIRLMPTVSSLTSTLTSMRGGIPGSTLMLTALDEMNSALVPAADVAAPPFQGDISISEVSFTFPDGDSPVLDQVSALIPRNSSIAFCGSSGSGKTTLVDLLLGLQTPDHGTITYSGSEIGSLGKSWRKRIGYIPQDIFLLDDSLAENIAFGERGEGRDDERIMECIRLASLQEFVESLPSGIGTQIGERGTRLSGGQRQRVGIARALYHDPAILVMDEATSALDNQTEEDVISTITHLSQNMTVVMVAHRLSTVRNVDQIIFLESGRVTGKGTFDEVRQSNPHFARLVELGDLGISTDSK